MDGGISKVVSIGGFGGELRYCFGEGPLAGDSAFLVGEFISSRGETV